MRYAVNMTKAMSRDLIFRIRDTEKKFRVSCTQLVLINNLSDEILKRHRQVDMVQRKPAFRHITQLKLWTLDGIQNMFQAYAHEKADRLEYLQRALYKKSGIVWSEELSRIEDETIFCEVVENILSEYISEDH